MKRRLQLIFVSLKRSREQFLSMYEVKKIRDAVSNLRDSITNFPIGAISLDDLKSTEDRIRSKRDALKQLNARLSILKAEHEYKTTGDEPKEEDIRNTARSLYEATANAHVNNMAIKLCLQSQSIQAILSGKAGDRDMKAKVIAYMRKLFSLNDSILSVQKAIEVATRKQLDLKLQCQNALFNYKDFLNEQEDICTKRLQKTNPEIARNKEKINKYINKINLMKRLIISFIAATHEMLLKEPILIEMLENHRDVINIETISKMSENYAVIQNENEDSS